MRGQRARFLIAMNAGEDADLDAMPRFHGLADTLREVAAWFSGIHFNHQVFWDAARSIGCPWSSIGMEEACFQALSLTPFSPQSGDDRGPLIKRVLKELKTPPLAAFHSPCYFTHP
jgi:hypothetical protein